MFDDRHKYTESKILINLKKGIYKDNRSYSKSLKLKIIRKS